jgi:hypothetical protein
VPDDKDNALVAWLLARMLRKTLFVALNRMVAPASEIAPSVADHLAYMNKLEAEGHLGIRAVHRRGSPRWRRPDDPFDANDRRGRTRDEGRAAHQAGTAEV